MTEQIKTEFATIGAEELLASLDKINKALGALAKNASKNLGVVDSVTDTISQLAQQYGEATDIAKRYFALAVDGAETQVEVEKAAFEAQKRINRMMREGADLQDVFRRAIIKTTKDRIASTQKAHQEAEAIEEIAKAEKKLANTKKDNTYSNVTRGINQARSEAERGQIDTNSAGATFDINAQIAAEKTAAANKEKLLEDLDSIQEEYFKKQKAREDKQVADRIAAADRFGTSATKAAFDRVEAEEAAAKKAKDADDELLANRMRFYTKDLAAYYKLADDKSSAPKSAKEAEDELLAEKMQFYQKDLAGYNKLSDARIAKEEKEFEEKLKLAKKYLAYEQDLRNGTVNKDRVSNTSAKDFVDLSTGKSIVDDVKANPQEFTRLAAAIRETEDALQDAARAKAKFVDQAAAASNKVKEFTLSWQTMGRIIVAQAFNEAFFAIQNGIRGSVTEAEELFKAVAEIQTIVNTTSRGLDNYFGALESVLQVSSEINFTPQDTANAFYETLSNQIGDNVTQIRSFIQEAGNLGKVTRATLADSADAITAVMNSYNKGVDEAAEISAQLFTLVDQGRVKLDEVANHMGNVSVPASQLGVDFENVVAALSAISIAGIPAREAMTLQRNVMFKLIDPTERMTELFKEWGVSSAQAAVAAFGFEGIIQRLAVEAEKGNEEIAALMGTIRGTRGILGLTGSNLKKYENALEAARKATEEYSKTVEEYLSNPGEKFAKLQQEISNEFLRMGLRIVDIIVKVNDFIQGTKEGSSVVADLVGDFSKLALVIGSAATAFLVVTTALAAVSSVIGALVFALGTVAAPVAIVIGAIAAITAALVGGVTYFAAFSESAEQEFARVQNEAAEMNKDVAKSFEKGILKTLGKDTELVMAKAKATLSSVALTISDINKEAKSLEAKKSLEDLAKGLDTLSKAFGGSEVDQKLLLIFESAEKIQELFGASAGWTNDAIDASIENYGKEVDAIQTVIDKLQEKRDALLETATANRINLAESITERNINSLPQNQRGAAQFDAAVGAANAAANAGSVEEAERLFQVARKFLQEAERSAFESGAFGTIENHTRYFNQQETELAMLQERRLATEDQLIASQQESAALQQKYYKEEQKIFQTEQDRRAGLETQYALEKAFLEEYIRLRDQILKGDLPTEEQGKRLFDLNRKTEQGLNQIGASQFTRDKFAAELGKNRADLTTEALRVAEEQTAKKMQELASATTAAKEAAAAFGTTITSIASNLSTAVGLLNDRTKVAGPVGGPGAIPMMVDNPEIAAIQSKSRELAAAATAETISLENYSKGMDELYTRTQQFMARYNIQDKQVLDALKTAKAQVEFAIQQKTLAVNLHLTATSLKTELDNLGAAVKATVDKLNNPIEDPVAAYNRNQAESGNSGSAEGEGDGESGESWKKKYLGPVLGAESFNEGMQTLVDGFFDSFEAHARLIIEKLSRRGLWSTPTRIAGAALKAAPVVGAASAVADSLSMAGDTPEAKKQWEDGVDQFNKNAGVLVTLGKAVEYAGVNILGVLDYFNFAAGQAADGATALAVATEQAAPKIESSVPESIARPADTGLGLSEGLDPNKGANAEDLARQQAEAGAQTFTEYLNSWIAYEQARIEAEAAAVAQSENARLINGLPSSMYPGQKINNSFNGQPYVDDGRNNSFNGQAIIEDGVNNAASWAIPQAMEQGAQQSIPQAMEQGSQSVAVAMQTGADAIGMSINQGMQAWSTRIAQGQNPEDYYNQGRRRFATGGPVGTDTIPAWLSKGEYVVNAQATKENFDYLQAINYGGGRRTQSNGGPVVNTQNFHSTFNVSSNNPTMQTTSIVNAMRRQISQGKATLAKRRPY